MTDALPERVAAGVLDSLAEAVTVHDERGKTVYANQAAARLLGARDVEEVLAAQPGELAARFHITKEDGSPVAVGDFPGRQLVDGGAGEPLLTRSVRRDTGEEFWLLTKATLLEEDGRRYAVNIIEDVTVQKRTELRRRFLDEAGQTLNASLDLAETLQELARLAVPLLADWCAISLPDGHGGFEQVAIAHVDPAKVAYGREMGRRYPSDPDAETGVAAVVRTGRPELYPEIPDHLLARAARDEDHLRILREIGMRAAMIVPLRAGRQTIGAMSFVSAESGRTYTHDDLAFAEDLAGRAGTAVENARLYTERALVARTLQASLLPERLPEVEGWALEAAYAAGERGSEVGGDFYDVFATPRGTMVVLGDVTGRGVAAAALTSTARHTARTAARFDPRPAAVIATVNQVLHAERRLAPVTLVCALLDGGRVVVASAGHPLPLLRRASGATEPFGQGGILLGAVAEAQWPETVVDVEPGDALLFYTDGVTDAPVAGGRFGAQRLCATVEAADPSPERLIAAVEAAVRADRVGGAIDDRAMLALQRR